MKPTASSLVVATVVLSLFGCDARTALEPFEKPVVVDIPRNTPSSEIAQILEDKRVISWKWEFLWHRVLQRNATLMAGEYILDRPVRGAEAFEMIASGRVRLYQLTVPEGLNRFEMAELIDKSGLASGEEFLELTADPTAILDLFPQATSLEGVLFPETYSLAKTSTTEDLVAAMVAGFRKALERARAKSQVDLDDWDALILASMVEEETGHRGERGLVASVFHNRIERRMLMQCDPTVAYGLILDDRYEGRVLRSHLSDPHLYNTYVHAGLPPGPITNPGAASLEAVFVPEDSDYLFFVASPGANVGHAFSATLSSHNAAVRELRRYQEFIRNRAAAEAAAARDASEPQSATEARNDERSSASAAAGEPAPEEHTVAEQIEQPVQSGSGGEALSEEGLAP